jgi:2'-deoxynucleoside 5'-phosphate N-hydrolase
MKIVFAGAIYGGREDWHEYGELITLLKRHGDVVTKHMTNGAFGIKENNKNESARDIFMEDEERITSSDAFVADISIPSLGVGYEIACAEKYHKPILCLYNSTKPRTLSSRIRGNPSITLKEYSTRDEAIQHIEAFFTNLSQERK